MLKNQGNIWYFKNTPFVIVSALLYLINSEQDFQYFKNFQQCANIKEPVPVLNVVLFLAELISVGCF